MTVRIITGHVLDVLRGMPDESVHVCVTSPPYYGLRDYGIEPQVWGGVPGCGCEHDWGGTERTKKGDRKSGPGMDSNDKLGAPEYAQGAAPLNGGAFCRRCGAWRGSLGLEPTLDLFLDHMVEIFREVRRALRRDGTCWLNIGDSYSSGGRAAPQVAHGGLSGPASPEDGSRRAPANLPGVKLKDLLLVPHRLAIRLCDDGWWVRSDIIWAKRAPMPESVTDRPTSAHEHVFLLAKSAKYFYDAEAVKEQASENTHDGHFINEPKDYHSGRTGRFNQYRPPTRALRNVWHLGPAQFPEAHFATFPPRIPEIAIRASCPVGGAVLDPFAGAGTSLLVADRLGRDAIGIELNPEYVAMIERRLRDDAGMFADLAAE